MNFQVKTDLIQLKKGPRLIAELSYFILPSKYWLLEQIFVPYPVDIHKYTGPLIKEFFKHINPQERSVRVLDPFAKSYLCKHPKYHRYLYQV